MKKTTGRKIEPFLWYSKEAEEAAKFYVSIFPKSKVNRVASLAADSPSGPAGSVKVVDFTLFGQPFSAMSAGPHDPFNDAVSFLVRCESQKEVDRYWDAILKNGGQPQACGWIIDKFGVRWQICPAQLLEWMGDRNRERAARVAREMLTQVKLDLPKLEAAYKGKQK